MGALTKITLICLGVVEAGRPRLWLPWVIALCAGVVATPSFVWINYAHARAVRDHQAAVAERVQRDIEAYSKVEAVWKKLFEANGKLNPSRRQAEDELNKGTPFSQFGPTRNGQSEATYTDKDSGATVYLRFTGDRWDSVRVDSSRPYTPRQTTRAEVFFDLMRRLSYAGGFLLSALLLLAAVVRHPTASVRAAHWFAAVSLAATWLALLGPRYWRNWSQFRQEDSAGWGVLVLLPIAAAMLIRAHFGGRGGPSHPVCEACGYNLTGNESGVCPECGHAASRPATSSKAGG